MNPRLKPLHEMTPNEFFNLSRAVQNEYPILRSGAGPSHTNYYYLYFIDHVKGGGIIPAHVWNEWTDQWKCTVTGPVGQAPVAPIDFKGVASVAMVEHNTTRHPVTLRDLQNGNVKLFSVEFEVADPGKYELLFDLNANEVALHRIRR